MKPSDRPSKPNRRTLSDERRRWVVEESEWESHSDVEVTEEHLEFFRDAGASEIYLAVVQADPEEFDICRNAVRSEAQEAIFYGEHEEPPDQYRLPSNCYFHELWEGNLYEAYQQAGLNSAVLLESIFSEDRINAARPAGAPKISELDPDRFFI